MATTQNRDLDRCRAERMLSQRENQKLMGLLEEYRKLIKTLDSDLEASRKETQNLKKALVVAQIKDGF